ncbi:MAG: hypothetical protein C4B58_07455 [Deltaproteobacteria bacterium]|nr:MAG: hypothetical protein C4B58_07455 [Deltaproteobacteria bacterium]
MFSFERKENKSYKPYGNYTILFVGIYALNDHILWFLRKHIFFCPLSRKKYIFSLRTLRLERSGR